MKSVDKTEDQDLLEIVEHLWPNYHPLQIADHLNATYRVPGDRELTATAIWNLHHAARRLDREARAG